MYNKCRNNICTSLSVISVVLVGVSGQRYAPCRRAKGGGCLNRDIYGSLAYIFVRPGV